MTQRGVAAQRKYRLRGDMAWQQYAACIDYDPQAFFEPTRYAEAQLVCMSCPVKMVCREYGRRYEGCVGRKGQHPRKEEHMRPLLLDLYAGAGGAAVGYHRAGFDVIGVDINPQPNYPFRFIQGDALEVLPELWSRGWTFDAYHASPPCQDHSKLVSRWGTHGTGWLLAATREHLEDSGVPWVIENVPGADMRADFKLCGCMFGLPGLRRERWFETSWKGFDLRSPCSHSDQTVTVTGHPGGSSTRDGARGFGSTADWKAAMGIDWMTGKELAQAIPPAYTEYLGAQLLQTVKERAA